MKSKPLFLIIGCCLIMLLLAACGMHPAENTPEPSAQQSSFSDETPTEYIELVPNDFNDISLTDEEKQEIMLEQTRARLAEMIGGMDGIEEATVDVQENSDGTLQAKVSYTMRNGDFLTDDNREAIRTLVSSSLPDVKTEHVMVLYSFTNENAALEQSYQDLLSSREELLELINQKILQHRNSTFIETPNHHEPWPEDFPSPTDLTYPLTHEDYVVQLMPYIPLSENSNQEGKLQIWVKLSDQQHYLVIGPAWFAWQEGEQAELGFGDSGFYKGELPFDFDTLRKENHRDFEENPADIR